MFAAAWRPRHAVAIAWLMALVVAQCALAFVAAAGFAGTTRFFIVKLETAPRYLVSRSCAELGPQLASNYVAPSEGESDIDDVGVRTGAVLSNGAPVDALVELRPSGENCVLTLAEFSSTNDSRIKKKDVQEEAILAFEERVLAALDAAYEKQSP